MARRKLTETEIKHKRTRILHKGYGQEPTWTYEIDPIEVEKKISKALSWYSACSDEKHKKKWLIEYLSGKKYPQNKLDKIQKLDEKYFQSGIYYFGSYCALCRMLLRGAQLEQSQIDKIYTKVEELLLVTPEEEKSRRGRKPGFKIRPAMRYDDNAKRIITTIDEKLDAFIDNNTPINFNFTSVCNKLGVSKEMAAFIIKRYAGDREDMEAVFNESDEYAMEAYGHLTNYQVIYLQSFYNTLFDGINAIVREEPKTVRKKRKIKPEVVTKKLKPLVEYKIPGTNLAIRSIDPINILGASQLWIFNVKYRKLGVFNAKSNKGFGVRGTKVLDFDPLTSTCKRVRKPNILLPEFMGIGKVALRHVMEKINQKEQNISPRINKDTILLRIIK